MICRRSNDLLNCHPWMLSNKSQASQHSAKLRITTRVCLFVCVFLSESFKYRKMPKTLYKLSKSPPFKTHRKSTESTLRWRGAGPDLVAQKYCGCCHGWHCSPFLRSELFVRGYSEDTGSTFMADDLLHRRKLRFWPNTSSCALMEKHQQFHRGCKSIDWSSTWCYHLHDRDVPCLVWGSTEGVAGTRRLLFCFLFLVCVCVCVFFRSP